MDKKAKQFIDWMPEQVAMVLVISCIALMVGFYLFLFTEILRSGWFQEHGVFLSIVAALVFGVWASNSIESS